MYIDDLKQISIKELKGIGDKNGSLFARLGIDTVYDLINFFPRDYIKLPNLSKVNELREGDKCACLLTVSDDFYFRKTSNNAVTTVSAFDDTGRIGLTFFRVTYLHSILKKGTVHVFVGTVKRKGNRYVMEMPEIVKPEEYRKNLRTLQPIYPLTKGITNKTMSKYICNALDCYGPFEDGLDEKIVSEMGFDSTLDSYFKVHNPLDLECYQKGRERLAFFELYDFFSGLNELKKTYTSLKSDYVFIETAEYTRFLERLPYDLTKGQKDALQDITDDLFGGFVMNRLVQGDVGSGKTIVAFLACLLAASNGCQAAFMAPTEVLAAQHYKNFVEMNNRYELGLNIAYLSGSTPANDKRTIQKGLSDSSINLVVGTHALFYDNVSFSNLSLVVTDEQHRFGVRQRQMLSDKGKLPHVLSLSATPIPRTLAGVYYTDLKVSVIYDKPSNRIPVKTGIRYSEQRVDGLRFIYKQIKEGRQAIVVCPMIEPNEDLELSNVSEYSKYLKELMPEDIRIGVLHGRMKNAEKNRVMEYFASGHTDILVSTTVIEVGIDVPNASVILIENAERFGLATLHQLRGRVGRGPYPSFCILINGSQMNEENERLNVLAKSDDGFHIADEDLRLRGPGDLLGVRQSGDMNFRIADLYKDKDLFIKAKQYADMYANT